MRGRKNKKLVYEELLNQHRPTIRSLLLEILRVKLFNLQKGKEPIVMEGARFVPEDDKLKDLPLKYLAIVDSTGEVREMIRINEQTASLIVDRSNEMIVFDPKIEIVKKGMIYKNNKFKEK